MPIAEIERAVEREPTHYARHILLRAVETLQDSCRQRVELTNPPARLAFRASDRPLPLLEPGVTCAAQVTVVNDGEASATDTELRFSSHDDSVTVTDERTALGHLNPKSRQDVSLSFVVRRPAVKVGFILEATWTNLDHTIGRAEATFAVTAHEVHIEWQRLEATEPFAAYPVEHRADLVGRERQLASLKALFTDRPLANRYLTGQRRVGKTSLVRVLVGELAEVPNLVVASVEMGEVRGAGGQSTIGGLGRKLADRVVHAAGLRGDVTLPSFDDSLAPLTDVVEQLLEWDDSLTFLFVIDEFDELPHPTYRRDGPGDALFVPMRSLAQKPNVGWLLVGGEKMPFIRDEQAARLNTFSEASVDYLPFADSPGGRGFADLVRRPLPDGFVVEDAAVRLIYEQSAGNPHFAKEICAAMFGRAVARRDALVTPAEVEAAVEAAARDGNVELFAHFWRMGFSRRMTSDGGVN